MRAKSKQGAGGAHPLRVSDTNWRSSVPHMVSGIARPPWVMQPGAGRIPDVARMRYPHSRRDVSATRARAIRSGSAVRPPQTSLSTSVQLPEVARGSRAPANSGVPLRRIDVSPTPSSFFRSSVRP